ncbi:DUF1569 domain-containing protein [Cryobacterium sp. TMB1-7]|uniref:DUF1569 domain-containing protein n=1 Tax=Cryobacterium sp. TMB1-7 TaxID=2555866 RepID=UPI00106D5B55|nr:DUF1569 domain-containing protein [Cryobacterium sp. TMB1-7]TFC59948.1 DUF1569 domain-containing protein [Cryobacterium sp. TMB1-7]
MSSPFTSSTDIPDAPSSLAALVTFVDTLESRVRQQGSGAALLSPRGTYSFSETAQHAAQSIGYSMTGYPHLAPVSLRVTVGRAVKHLFLRRGAMRHNLSAPVSGAPELDPAMPDLAAVAVLRTAVNALVAFTGDLQPHPTYGRCTKAQVANLQTQHLREHLPGADAPAAPQPATPAR